MKYLFFSFFLILCACSPETSDHSIKEQNPVDTVSSDYLISEVKAKKTLPPYWINQLKSLHDFAFSFDSIATFDIAKDWIVNDSVSAVILTNSDGLVCMNEYLLTFLKKDKLISTVCIKKECDSDCYPYDYIDFEYLNEREITVNNHEVFAAKSKAESETDSIMSTVTFIIQNNGAAELKKNVH